MTPLQDAPVQIGSEHHQSHYMDKNSCGISNAGRNETTTETAASTTNVVQLDPNCSTKYMHFTADQPFRKPSAKSALEISTTELNLYLGCSFFNRAKNPMVLKIIQLLLSLLLVDYWEQYAFRLYNAIPVPVRRAVTFLAWNIYFPIHRCFLKNTTSIHPDASLEYHALTTIMYWGRFFPVNIHRMRFMLHQLTPCQPASVVSSYIETIDEAFIPSVLSPQGTSPSNSTAAVFTPPNVQKNFCHVRGKYLHYHSSNQFQPHGESSTTMRDDTNGDVAVKFTEYTLFWLYGGAYLSGDAIGNIGPADTVGSQSGPMDVFIPTYRLAPEYCMDDILWDIVLSYRWLYDVRQRRGQDPNKILLFGCSSGAALCIRLMQYISEIRQQKTHQIMPPYIASILMEHMMPYGAALASPYLEYSPMLDPHGSFVQYSQHDLIVTEAVQEAGLPYLRTNMGISGNRIIHSPLQHTMDGLPPLCIILSEHETVYDETVEFIHLARQAGVPVTVGLWKYVCHVFLFLHGFIPEGQQSIDFICQWYHDRQQQQQKRIS
jgi:acetyl esterase/lipase